MTKTIIYIAIGVVIIAFSYYLLFMRKNGNNTQNSVLSDGGQNIEGQSNTAINTSQNGGTGTNSGTAISISNAAFSTSPLIGQKHLTATVNVANQPQTGTLVILVGNVFVSEVSLPLLNGTYNLDEYVVLPQQSTYNLTAKIGSITKTVQVTT